MEVWIQCTVAPFLVLSAARVYVQTASLRLNINRAALRRQRRTSRLSARLPVLEEAVKFSSRQKTALTQQCRSATEKRRDKAPPPVAVETEAPVAPVAVVAVEMTGVTIVSRCLQTLT